MHVHFQNIYSNCNTLALQYSNLSEVMVKFNNERSYDFTNPNLPTMNVAELQERHLAVSSCACACTCIFPACTCVRSNACVHVCMRGHSCVFVCLLVYVCIIRNYTCEWGLVAKVSVRHMTLYLYWSVAYSHGLEEVITFFVISVRRSRADMRFICYHSTQVTCKYAFHSYK